jgi:type IV secretory pathway TrbD component
VSDELRPHTTRLYSSLSEPRSVLGMDHRMVWATGVVCVAGIVLIPFGGWLCYAPSVACWLLGFGLARLGRSLWDRSPYFVDEYLAHVRCPLVGGADERPSRWT